MTAKTTRYDLAAHENDIFSEEIRFTKNGQLLSLAGLEFELQIKLTIKGSSILTLSSGDGIELNEDQTAILIDDEALTLTLESWGNNNRMNYRLPPVVALVYQLKVTLPGGGTETWLVGLFNYELDI